jgi:hypothetical protein
MGFYGDQVLPRITNVLLANAEFKNVRERVASGLSGEILEVGFGSGLNVPFYPTGVRRVLAVTPRRQGGSWPQSVWRPARSRLSMLAWTGKAFRWMLRALTTS